MFKRYFFSGIEVIVVSEFVYLLGWERVGVFGLLFWVRLVIFVVGCRWRVVS